MAQGPETVDALSPPSTQSLRDILDRVAGAIRRLDTAQATGELAALRRLDPEHPLHGALFRLLAAADVPERLTVPDRLPAWATLAAVLARAPEALTGASLGAALRNADILEGRVIRLFATRGKALRQQVRRLVPVLQAHGLVPYRDLGALLLNDGHNEDAADHVRLRIAGDYYAPPRKETPTPAATDTAGRAPNPTGLTGSAPS